MYQQQITDNNLHLIFKITLLLSAAATYILIFWGFGFKQFFMPHTKTKHSQKLQQHFNTCNIPTQSCSAANVCNTLYFINTCSNIAVHLLFWHTLNTLMQHRVMDQSKNFNPVDSRYIFRALVILSFFFLFYQIIHQVFYNCSSSQFRQTHIKHFLSQHDWQVIDASGQEACGP